MVARLSRVAVLVVVPLVVFGLSKVHAAWVADDPYDFTASARLVWASGFIVVIWIAAYAVGLPSLVRGTRDAVVAALVAVGVGVGAVSAVQLLLGDALLPRFVVFGSALVLIPALALTGVVGASGRRQFAGRARVLFVGGRGEAIALSDDLARDVERPATLLGAMDIDEAERGGDSRVLDEIDALDSNLLVLDVRAQALPNVVAQAAIAHERGIRIRTLSLFYEEWLGKLPVTELERVSLLFDVGEVHRVRYSRAKRVFDIAAGLVGCLFLALAIPFVLAGNAIGNRGPLIFRQERVGKGGTVFTILKFRTMRPGVGAGEWTRQGDDRITSFGGLLRRSHLDELPQVLNILRGDLSLVGPRPEQPHYVDELQQKLPFYKLRHLVRPGLTGWAQVKYGYAGDERDALEKLQYEFFYLRRQTLGFDLRIVGRTLRHIGTGGGR